MGNELTIHESQQLAVQVDVANKYPRKLDTFVDSVFQVVKRDPDFAMSCIYCVPVGKTDGVQRFELGPSVRLSEEMQKYWKHLRVAVNCEVTDTQIICSGMIIDCEANNAETLTDIVSIVDKQYGKWNDRRINLKVKAMQSTMKRDLRLSIMGKSYANELIEKILENLLPDQVEAWTYCVQEFDTIGVSEQTILNYFKVSSPAELTKKDVYKAIGIFNFIKDQGEDGSYVFGSGNNSSKPSVTPSDVKVNSTPKGTGKKAPIKKEERASQVSTPEVMGQDDFEKLVFSLLLGCGMSEADLDTALEAELSIKGLKDVKPEDQSKVIDFLTAKQEQARA